MNEEKTTFTFKEQTGFGIARSDIELTTGKVIVNDIEITSVEDWERVTNSLIKLQNNWNELKKWLEECLNEIKQNDVYDRTSYEQGQIIALESSIAKAQELEQDKDG